MSEMMLIIDYKSKFLFISIFLSFLFFTIINGQVLNPPYFNIAEGRNITATATCGENVPEPELYCKIVGSNWLDETDNLKLIEGQACDFCDPRDLKKAHPPQYAIDGTERWWQSPPLSRGSQYSKVNLTLDLGQEFNVAYVFIKMGNSPRPGVWILERSRDYGQTYTPWQYFADTPQDCANFFGQHTLQPITKDDSVICETKFSKLVPLENGEMVISLINGRPSADNFSMSTTLQEWTTATNIRLRFLRPKTTLSVAQEEPTVTRRYFYSVKDINIGGQCVCNGHASQCDQSSPHDPLKLSCACQHNTCGLQCERCCIGYQQYEWRRATVDDHYVCEKCNCHGHSNECYYDANVAAKNLSMNINGHYIGGGVCMNCQHNTTGINCHQCKDGFFRPRGKSLDAIDVCQQCQCDLKFSTGNCFNETGQCECRKNYKAPNCDECNIGYFGYPECQECPCFPNGTINDLCELPPGDTSCPCKENYDGHNCKKCANGFYQFPECKPCKCHPTYSIENSCHYETGQCKCLEKYGGTNCMECNIGFYGYPNCKPCNCRKQGSTENVCNSNTGECFCKEGYEMPWCDKCSPGYYGFPNCVKCDCNAEGSVSNSCDKDGKCHCKKSYGGTKCNDCAFGYYNFPKCEKCKCHLKGSTGNCDHSGKCVCHDGFEGLKCDQCKEGYYNFPQCEECNCNPAGLVAEFGGCDKVEMGKKLCECKERVKGRTCNQCKDLYWNLQMNNPYGCEECRCNRNGTLSHIGICDTITGKCMCKENVHGQFCKDCKPNTYMLDSGNLFGCVDCGCDIGGALSSVCDKFTGQCRCKSGIRGKTCSETSEASYFPTFYQFQYEAEDWYNPTGSPARFGYEENFFPNHSWRGYAVFNQFQKEIYTNITITKTSIYKIIVHYVNKNNETVNGLLKFVPNEWMSDEEQSVSISFEPTNQPKLLYVTGRQSNGMLSLGVGPWQIFFQADKFDFFIDYIVLIPQAYYDPSLLQERKAGPCLYFSTNDFSCILHAYPNYPAFSKIFPASEALVIKEDSGQIKPITIESPEYQDNLKEINKFVTIDLENPNLEFEFVAEDNGTNLLILNYHTATNLKQSIAIEIEVENLSKNQTLQSRNLLPACPYLFACRKAITTNEGKLMTFEAMADDPFRMKIQLSFSNYSQPSKRQVRKSEYKNNDPYDNNNNHNQLNLSSITMMPYDNRWQYNYIEPKFVCMFKNGNCMSSTFPIATDGIKIEAETDQKSDNIVELPTYSQINSESIPRLVQLNDSMQAIDIRGAVSKPGQYYFILNYYQPNNPNFNMESSIRDGQIYRAIANLQHCPNVVGCRVSLKQRETDSNFNSFQIQKNFIVSLNVPKNENVFIDYLLVVPAEKFDEQTLVPEPPESSMKNKMSECMQNNYYIDPKNASYLCRSLVFSTTVDFNGGSLPCKCKIDGSYDHKCEDFGGQCKCKPNVIGRDCSSCKTGYYGWPNCKKCDCPSSAICDSKTGDCICPKGVTGKDCDKCLPLTFGFDKLVGCEDCACNPRGVLNRRDLSCNLETGDCKCKQNIVGRKCDKCKPGFFGFPNCHLCRCDVRGTTQEICDQNTARCYCKKNVDGTYCDRCKTDSYYLEESNQHGCTKCFCFGNIDRCTGSSLVFVPILLTNTDLELYNLFNDEYSLLVNRMKKNEDYELDYTADKFAIRTSFAKDTTIATNSNSAIYIKLPKEYLGNKILSYGGEFQYSIMNKILNDYNPSLPMADIILIGRNKNYTLVHENVEKPVINESFNVTIKLLENEFKRLDGSFVTREQFMMTLVDLDAIYVRVKYFDSLHDTVDIEYKFRMDTAVSGNKIIETPSRKATSVEQCHCPPNYRGTSCEECAEGYYRVPQGPYLGACIPCNCNGHSNECDPVTGKCFNCKFNTEGDHCERCREGYYGDATQGTPNDCLICACPSPIESNNFATSCEVSSSGSVLSCNCKDGYNGTRCENCGAGHYGQPQIRGQTCQKCECNNNIDVTDPNSCDPISGHCLKCLFNSSGQHCERCGDWHYGDSIHAKNCSECSCDKCGAESCDHKTAACKCQPNVIGKNCDQCAPGFYGISSCKGCRPCNCSEASHDLNCDDSGQCPCKTGAAGKSCDTCAPGFWGYSKYGCTSCGCNEKYSRVKQCNQITGQCQCLPGVIGAKCEKCPDRWVLVPESGCQECGDCIHTLLNDADQIKKDIEFIESQTHNTSSSVLANRKLDYVGNVKKKLEKQLQETFANTEERTTNRQNFTKVKKESEDLLDNIEKMDIKADSLEKEFIKVFAKVNKAYNDSLNRENQIKSVRQLTVQVVENISQLENSLAKTSHYLSNTFKDESEQILIELQKPYLNDHMKRFDIDLTDFNNTLGLANNFYDSWAKMKDDIERESIRLNNLTNLISELKILTAAARNDTFESERILQRGLKDVMLKSIGELKTHSDKAENITKEANDIIDKSKQNIIDLENMKIDIEQQKERLVNEMHKLNETVEIIGPSLIDVKKDVIEAENHAQKQENQSKYLNELMSSTKNQAMDPLKAANAYDNISSTVEESETTTNDIKNSPYLDPDFIKKEFIKLENINLDNERDVKYKLQNSTNILHEQKNFVEDTKKIIDDKTEQFKNLNQSFNKLDVENDKARSHENIRNQVNEVNKAERKVNDLIKSIDNLKLKDIKDYSDFVNDIKEGKDFVDRIQRDVERLNNVSSEMDPVDLNNEFNRIKSGFASKIADLKKRIILAQHQAANMKLGVKLNQNSVLELNNPPNLVESSAYNKFSMRFQSESPNGVLVYLGNPIDGSNENRLTKRQVDLEDVSKTKRKSINYDFMCLELRNGKVFLIWDLGAGNPTILEDRQEVYDGRWHQVIVERFGRLIRMTVNTDTISTTSEKVAIGWLSVFDLDREHSKIYIGSVPNNVQLNSEIKNYQPFAGTISNVILDNEPLGLWNAKNAYNIQGAPTYESQSENVVRFNGNSYVLLDRKDLQFHETVFVSFQFKTFNQKGLLFLIGSPSKKTFFSIELNDGKIVVQYEFGSSSTMVLSNNAYNDGQWHFVKVNREGKECLINVDNVDEQSAFSMGLRTVLYTDDYIYIGGYKGQIPYDEVTKEGFDGCIKDLQIDSVQQNLNNPRETFGTLLGCSTFFRVASFTEQAKAYIIFENQTLASTRNGGQDITQITFKFRTLSKNGMFLCITNADFENLFNFITVYLSEGMLILKINNEQPLQTENQYYNDNKWHFITIILNQRNLEMDVDDKNPFSIVIDNSIDLSQLKRIFVGGLPNDKSFSEFIGCIGDITINYKFLNFADSNSKMNALFKKCPLTSVEEEELLVPNFKDLINPEKSFTKAPSAEYLEPIDNCQLPPIPQETDEEVSIFEKRFGNTLWSRYEFPISNDVAKGLENESGFQLKFKTTQADGILFYITSSNNIDFVGVYFLNNKLHYSFDCGSGRGVVVLEQNFTDNQWHTVTFSRKGKIGLIRVDDGPPNEVSSVGFSSSLNVITPIYVGGVPKELRSQLKSHLKSVDKNDFNYAMSSFSGCIKDLKVRELEYNFNDGREFDVTPCSTQIEYGHFFPYDGGYIQLFDEFRVRVEFTLILEIKPRKPDGILAAVFGKVDYLVLYMDKGKIFFSVDNGAVPITAVDELPYGICDGKWHTIKAFKTKNLVMLTIDDRQPQMSTGQPGISSTDTKDPLYIGGLPSKLKEEKRIQLNNVKDDYLGCLRIKSINGMPHTLNSAKIEGHITLNTCSIV